jgi:nucleoside-diphosphate-sugar epimerase
VDNVVETLVLCGKMPQATGQVYNLSDQCTLEHFVATIAKVLRCGVPLYRMPELPVRALAKLFGSIPGVPLTQNRINALTTRVIYSSEKIEQELGYRHLFSMEDGLRDLVGYWQSGCNKS